MQWSGRFRHFHDRSLAAAYAQRFQAAVKTPLHDLLHFEAAAFLLFDAVTFLLFGL